MPRTPSPAAAHIGSLITEQRLARRMTVDQLAAASMIDSANIRSYEAGRSLLSVFTLVRIATALKVQPGTLLKGLDVTMFP